MRIETLRLAKELENGYLFPREQIVAELFRLNDLLGKANALARMRADELRRLHEISLKYSELLYAVHEAFPDENRHQTALRYITQTERLSIMCESAKEQA